MFWRIDRTACAWALANVLFGASPAALASAADEAARPANGTLRVLILTGQGDHDWRATTPLLRRILEDTGRFEVRVCEIPAGLTAQTLDGFDVVVDDVGGTSAGGHTEKAIDDFVKAGKGLVMTHGSMNAPPGAISYSRAHLAVGFLDVKTTRPDHPIVAGLPVRVKTADSYFVGVKAAPEAEVLATSSDEPILMVAPLGKGRAFTCALGHNPAAIQEPWFMTTFARGTEWAATGAVTLPDDLDPSRPTRDAVRALLITGGHDHEASFYALFGGFRDLARMPVASSGTAFRSDLRGKYDVVVMYDFTRTLDDASKKNLRDFVESGGGVVVLHHALLNYQDWSWWYEDAVGGSYRLKTEGKVASSIVKDRESFLVTPDRQHPITAHLDVFHLVDEAYKRMWMSPRILPLIVTDSPNSDRVVGWVGPSAGFRVVAIQLGHGPSAFTHPTYRSLVHNAILWSAGRLK